MITETMTQGSEEWRAIRRGVPTASCFDRILTPVQLKRSAQREDYLNQLVAESYGVAEDWNGTEHTERGTELEPEAADLFSILHDCDVQRVGFVWRDERQLVGCSPDILVGDVGGCEIKCPTAKVQLKYFRGGKVPTEYLAQVYGNLWITQRKWWSFFSYHPSFASPFEVRIHADDPKYLEWVSAWEPEIEDFCQRLAEVKEEAANWFVSF